MSPSNAWNMTLIEYLNLLKCEGEQQDIDESQITKERIKEIELRHEINKAERLGKNGKG